MIVCSEPKDAVLAQLLAKHPFVQLRDIKTSEDRLLEFTQESGWSRSISWSGKDSPIRGLVELIDNNPMVCADFMSLPTASATLTMIALGPLIRAGIILESPALHFNFTVEPDDVQDNLELFGWNGGATLAIDEQEFGSALILNAMAKVPNFSENRVFDELFEESFGRSFFVHAAPPEADWDIQLVSGTPNAVYNLRITPGEDDSLLTVQVMADKDGKCGAAQVIHAMNVMVGFEESLGLDQL